MKVHHESSAAADQAVAGDFALIAFHRLHRVLIKTHPLPQAGLAAAGCMAVMVMLHVLLAPWLLLASVVAAISISWLSGGAEMGAGDAIAGMQYSIALQVA